MSLTAEKIKYFKKEYKDLDKLRETIWQLGRKSRLSKADQELLWDLSTYRLTFCVYGGRAFNKPTEIIKEQK